jgi:hypothetical protein
LTETAGTGSGSVHLKVGTRRKREGLVRWVLHRNGEAWRRRALLKNSLNRGSKVSHGVLMPDSIREAVTLIRHFGPLKGSDFRRHLLQTYKRQGTGLRYPPIYNRG